MYLLGIETFYSFDSVAFLWSLVSSMECRNVQVFIAGFLRHISPWITNVDAVIVGLFFAV